MFKFIEGFDLLWKLSQDREGFFLSLCKEYIHIGIKNTTYLAGHSLQPIFKVFKVALLTVQNNLSCEYDKVALWRFISTGWEWDSNQRWDSFSISAAST